MVQTKFTANGFGEISVTAGVRVKIRIRDRIQVKVRELNYLRSIKYSLCTQIVRYVYTLLCPPD